MVVGIVEYTRVDYTRPGLPGARLDSYRVSSTGQSCPHSRGEYRNASAISHVSWAAAIAVGRGSTYKGIANAARLVDVSADSNPYSDAADPRILKAVDCAILQGGAHLITMSLVQNDSSRLLHLERLLRCRRLGPPSTDRRQRREQLLRVELALPRVHGARPQPGVRVERAVGRRDVEQRLAPVVPRQRVGARRTAGRIRLAIPAT